MRKSIRPIVSVLALFIVIGAIFFAGKPELISGQRLSEIPSNRKPACSVFCGDATMNYIVLAEPPACWGGPLPAGNAGNHFKELPKDAQNMICKNLKSAGRTDTSCPAFKTLMAACDQDEKESPKDQQPPEDKTPPEKKCEKPTPWFDPPPKCLLVSPRIAVNRGAVTLSICASPVFRYIPEDKDPLLLEAYKSALRDWVQQRIGSKICCKQFRAAERSGTPCNPVADLDCDGIPNQTDVVFESGASFPDINNLFSSPEGAPIDPFPFGLDPDDPNFLPPPEKCDCKWELVKGTLNCSPDGKQRHFYEARWKCPSTGNERFTRKYASATAPCP